MLQQLKEENLRKKSKSNEPIEANSGVFGGLFKGNAKVEDKKVEQMKQKLDKVDEEKSNQVTNDSENKNDEDLNVLLKQLTKYLENK